MENTDFKKEYSHLVWTKAYPIHSESIRMKNEVGAYLHKTVAEAKAAALKVADQRIAGARPDGEFPIAFWKDVRFMISIVEDGNYNREKWFKYLETSEHYINIKPEPES